MALLSMKDIAEREAIVMALPEEPEIKGNPKVTGGSKAKKSEKGAKTTAQKAENVKRIVNKVMAHTPAAAAKPTGKGSKGKPGSTGKGGKRSAAKVPTAHMPLPEGKGGKNSKATVDNLTMTEFKKYLEWHELKKKVPPVKSPAAASTKRSKK